MKVCTRHREASELCWQRAGELNPGLYAALSTSWPILIYFGSAACCASNGAEKYGLTVWRSKQCQLLFTTWTCAIDCIPQTVSFISVATKKTPVSCPCALKKSSNLYFHIAKTTKKGARIVIISIHNVSQAWLLPPHWTWLHNNRAGLSASM